MWFEYLCLEESDCLLWFGELYDETFKIYCAEASGKQYSLFSKRKGDILTHRFKNTFVKLKKFADDNIIKYDDFWAFCFEIPREFSWFKFFGVTSFSSPYVLSIILKKEQEKYANRIKLPSSATFDAKYYNPERKDIVMCQTYLVMQAKAKYPSRYLEVLKDLYLSEKLSLDFLKEKCYSDYEMLVQRYKRII